MARNNPQKKTSWDKERTRELFEKYRECEDEAIREEIIETHLNLVSYLASKFRNRGESMDDLIQVGTVGLIKAVDRFDTSRDIEFMTYATPTIMGEIKRHFRDKGWAIRVPRRLQELSYKIGKTTEALTVELQRSPTVDEIAERLEVSVDEIFEAMESSGAYAPKSLNAPTAASSEGDSFSLLDHVGIDDPLLRVADDKITLQEAISQLDPDVQKALYLRFYEGYTQTEIAKEIEVSQIQVSRLLRRALTTLRGDIDPEEDEGQPA